VPPASLRVKDEAEIDMGFSLGGFTRVIARTVMLIQVHPNF
jgi:predicted rRNA methylase YqxC with S4 and FtsJ domains